MNNYDFNRFNLNITGPFVILIDENQTYSAYILDKNAFVKSKTGNYEINALIGSIAMMVLCFVGLASNLLSFLIFKHKKMQSSINVLLAALSLIDLVVVLLAVPVFVLPALNEYLRFEWIKDHYYFVILYLYPLAMMAQTSSIWTFILITVERFYAVCFPLNTKLHLTTRRAKFTQLIVVIAAILYNIVRFWEFHHVAHTEISLQTQSSFDGDIEAIPLNLQDLPTKTVHEAWPMLRQTSSAYFNYYYVGGYLLTHCVAPFLIVLALNLKIVCCIRRAGKQRAAITNRVFQKYILPMKHNSIPTASNWLLPRSSPPTATPPDSVKRLGERARLNTTKMVFIVTILFFLCNAFSPILSIWEACQPDLFNQSNLSGNQVKSPLVDGNPPMAEKENDDTISNQTIGGFLLVDLSNLGVLLNASTNFIVYLIYCRRYRRYFESYFRVFCLSNKNNSKENAPRADSCPSGLGYKFMAMKQLKTEFDEIRPLCHHAINIQRPNISPPFATTGRLTRVTIFKDKVRVSNQRCLSVTTI